MNTAIRAIGADIIRRNADYIHHAADTRIKHLCTLDGHGNAQDVYAHLIKSWSTLRYARVVDVEDTPPGELTPLELGCRLYSAIMERDDLSADLVKAISDAPGVTLVEAGEGIGLTISENTSGRQCSALQKWRSGGVRYGVAVHALWSWYRDNPKLK